MYQSWHARLWSSNWQPRNQWLKKSGILSHRMPIPGWLELCCPDTRPVRACAICSLAGHCSKAGACFHPEVRPIASTHITLINTSHMATPDLKGLGARNLSMPQKEENQKSWRTAFLKRTLGLFQDSAQGHFQSPFSMHKHLFEDAERKCMLLSYILLL